MGCIASKNTVTITPAFDNSGSIRDQAGNLPSSLRSKSKFCDSDRKKGETRCGHSEESEKWRSNGAGSLSLRLSNLHRYIEGEQVAAGWPAWLSAVAGEAIQGWVPLKADSFEKLEKIGQGTYSSVFRARDLDTGKVVALKKVRFDNFEPESVRFMAREIQILRRLDHPNIVKLEGLITSRLSCSLYLVFEYMEHDLAGLSTCPDISFSEAQVKCYMHQLLSGLEHCQSRGVMHRDIKCSNLLVNNEGILKIGDFGLANSFSPGQVHPLTSRVVTLWYRPPELLLGSTDYVSSVDLWSVGCVFAELLLGKPILQGRTEVEQLHKIFKLCGSPPEEYWKKSKLPHATIFKPQHPYKSSLRETYKSLPLSSMGLLETFLSVEPYKRGTATSALKSEYFATKPLACEPSSLPIYPPNKEIDAKIREELRRKGLGSRGRGSGAARRPSRAFRPAREPNRMDRVAIRPEELQTNKIHAAENDNMKLRRVPSKDGKSRLFVDLQPMPEMNHINEPLYKNQSLPVEIPFSGPLPMNASSGFAWAKKRREDSASTRSRSRSSLTGLTSDMSGPPASGVLHSRSTVDPQVQENNALNDNQIFSKSKESYKISKQALLRQWAQLERPDSFDASNTSQSQDFSESFYLKHEIPSNRSLVGFNDQGEDKVEFSGPLLCQSHKVDELLEKHERHIRQAMRRSWFQRGWRHGK